MDLARLRVLLRPVLGDEVEPLYERFRTEHGTGDFGHFVANLHERGLIDNDRLREVLTSEEVSFTLSEAQGRRAGPSRRTLGLLGKGAMGEVLVARDEELHRNVAVKRMDPRIADKPSLANRFYTEVQITAQLDHPNIVPVYGMERDPDGTLSYTMKLLRGRTLADFLEDVRDVYDSGREPNDDQDLLGRLELFLQVCNALHYAHSRGVIHRDLKPENIMVGAFHEVTVMDWGIAKRIGAPDDGAVVHMGDQPVEGTQIGTALGTPPYMSPEQAAGKNDELDARSDQYSLGLLLYELVCLGRAVTAKTAMAALQQARHAQKNPITGYRGKYKVPRELAAILDKATAPAPEDRYPDVEALADDVRRYLRDEAVLAQPDGPFQRVARWISHHRELTLGVVMALVLMIFLVGAVTIAGGAGVVIAQGYAAAQREHRLGEALGHVSDQAHRIDVEFRRYETLLEGLASLSEHILQEEVAPRPIYFTADFLTEGRGPPDLRASPVYGAPISLAYADNHLAPAVDPKAVEPRLWQTNALQPYLLEMLLRSVGEQALDLGEIERRELIADRGVPMVWAYIATEEGMITGLPGKGDYPEDYDPRLRSWYTIAAQNPGLVWSVADWDESGMGLLMPCTVALRDDTGQLLGVAALDVAVGHVIDELLDPEGISGVVEAYLVDADGRVVVQSSLKDLARTGKGERKPPPFPHPEVVDALKASPTGYLELSGNQGRELVVWNRLDAVEWTYVVVGPSKALLGGW